MRTRSREARGQAARSLLTKSGILDSDSPDDSDLEETSDIESDFSEYSPVQETSQSSSPVSDSPEMESITPKEPEKPILKPVPPPKLNILEILCDSSSQESDINDADELKQQQENGSSDLSSFVTHVTSSETPEKTPEKSVSKPEVAPTVKFSEPIECEEKQVRFATTTIRSLEKDEERAAKSSNKLAAFATTTIRSFEAEEERTTVSSNKLAAFATTTIRSLEAEEERTAKSSNKLAAFATTTIRSFEAEEERRIVGSNKLAAFATTTIRSLETEESPPLKHGNKVPVFAPTKSGSFSDHIMCSQQMRDLESYSDPVDQVLESLSSHDDSLPDETMIYQTAKLNQNTPRELLIYETSQVEPHDMYVFAVHDQAGKVFLFCKSEGSSGNDYETCCLCITSPKITISFAPAVDANRNKMEREVETVIRHCNGKVFSKEWKMKMSLNQTSQDWLDVTVSSDIEIEKLKMKGKTYTNVSGVTSCVTDDLVSERKLKGGQWITVHCSQSPHYHTTVPMYAIADADGIHLIDKIYKPAYNVCLMTLHMFHGKVVLMSLRIFSQWDVDKFTGHADTTSSGQKVMSLVVAPRPKTDQNADSTIYCPNEAALLACFVDKIDKEDIDILVGYDLKNVIPFLVSRMGANGVNELHKLGRFAKTDPTATMKDITAGRMICDLKAYFQDFLDQPNDDFSDLVASQLQETRPNLSESKIYKLLSSKPADLSSLIVWSRKDTLYMKRILQEYSVLNACEYIARITGVQWIDSTWRGNEALVETYLINSLHAKGYIVPELQQKANKGCFKLPVPKIDVKHGEMIMFEIPFWILKLMKDINFCVTTVSRDNYIRRKPSGVLSAMITELNNSLVRLEEQYPGIEDKERKMRNESMRNAIGVICRAIPKYFNGTSHRFNLSLLSQILSKEVESFCDKLNGPVLTTENYIIVDHAEEDVFERHQYKFSVKSATKLNKIVILGQNSFIANSDAGERIQHNVLTSRWNWCSITNQICSQLFDVVISSHDIEYDLPGKLYDIAKSDILSPKSPQDWEFPVVSSAHFADDSLSDFMDRLERNGPLVALSDKVMIVRCTENTVKRRQDVRNVSEIDVKWYIEHQILPAVLLLTKHFVDFSKEEIRACFNDSEEDPCISEDSLTYKCYHCSRIQRFIGVGTTLKCDHCKEELNWKYLSNSLIHSIRMFVKRWASQSLNCSAYMCSYHTSQVPLSSQIMKHAGAETFRTSCCGHQIMERNQQELYSRLKDFNSLFERKDNANNDVMNLTSTMREYLRNLIGHHDFSSMRLSTIMSPSSVETQSDDGACFSFIE